MILVVLEIAVMLTMVHSNEAFCRHMGSKELWEEADAFKKYLRRSKETDMPNELMHILTRFKLEEAGNHRALKLECPPYDEFSREEVQKSMQWLAKKIVSSVC